MHVKLLDFQGGGGGGSPFTLLEGGSELRIYYIFSYIRSINYNEKSI